MSAHQTRWVLIGVSAGVVMALLALPSTRWLVAQQALLVVRPSDSIAALVPDTAAQIEARYSPPLHRDIARAVWREAARHPDNATVQIVAAILGSSGTRQAARKEAVQRLKALAPRFGDRPELWALLLANAQSGLLAERQQSQRRDAAVRSDVTPASVELEQYDEAAVDGERTDPDNAFFPMARAAGLFAAYRDDDAADAVLRAGRCRRYDDYLGAVRPAAVRLLADVRGDPSSFRRIADAGLVGATLGLYPGAVAHLAVAHAQAEERAGGTERGLAIRRALVRVGVLLSDNPRNLTVAMPARVAILVAAQRPPVLPPPGAAEAAGGSPSGGRAAWAAYTRFLDASGRSQEAQEARAALALAGKVEALFMSAGAAGWMGGADVERLVDLWICGVLVLLALGGAVGAAVGYACATWVARVAAQPRGRRALRAASIASLLLAVVRLSAVLLLPPPEQSLGSVCAGVGWCATAAAVAWWVWLPSEWTRVRAAGAAVLCTPAMCGLVPGVVWGGGGPQLADLAARWTADPWAMPETHAPLVVAGLFAPVVAAVLALAAATVLRKRDVASRSASSTSAGEEARLSGRSGARAVGWWLAVAVLLFPLLTRLADSAAAAVQRAVAPSGTHPIPVSTDPVVLAAIVLAPAAGCLVVLLCAALLRAATSVARPWQVALPTAAALLATYGCIAIATARQEEVVRSGHVRLLERGGLYLAELQGTTWPGRAR